MTQDRFAIELGSGPPPRDKKGEQAFVDGVMYWLTAPYLTWPGYEDIYRANGNREKALVRRLAQYAEIATGRVCTEFEAMLYISTATLVNPPSHNWYRIYMYLFLKEMPEQAKACGFDEVKELYGTEVEDLLRLRRWIYQKQAAHLKERVIPAKAPPAAAAAPKPANRKEVVAQQAFDFGGV